MRADPATHASAMRACASGEPTALDRCLAEHRESIEAWLLEQWQLTPPPFYCSVDLRDAGYKLAAVDTNLFPAGFNNLHADLRKLAARAAQTLRSRHPDARSILLIPENHTRNRFYLENVGALQEILSASGFIVRIGSLLPGLREPTVIMQGPYALRLEPVLRRDDRVRLSDFNADIVLLNNDLSSGLPSILDGITQPIVPPAAMGWAWRRKTRHFAKYDMLSRLLCRRIGIDPWLIAPAFRHCSGIDFLHRHGEQCLLEMVDVLLSETRAKYREYGIRRDPFVAIKADAGTYGMSVMMVRSPEQLRGLNRKQRSKMAAAKDGVPVREVILQEGVPAAGAAGEAPAEPVLYLIGGQVIGGFYRVHSGKGSDDNLNAPGMMFVSGDLADAVDGATPRGFAYSVIGRLAALAAAHEIQDVQSSGPGAA